MSGRVFISHSEKDKRFSEAVLNALEGLDIKCWIAPRDIPPGGSYADAILTAIEQCACFVLIYTERCNNSGHVLREVERALNLQKNIVPIRFDESAPSRSLDYLLATVHWLSVPDESVESGVARASTQIAACVRPATAQRQPPLPKSVARSAAPPSETPTLARRSRPTLLVSLLVGTFVIALSLGLFLTKSFQQTRLTESVPDRAVMKESPSTASSAVAAAPSILPSVAKASPPQSDHVPALSSGGDPKDTLYRYYESFGERDPVAAHSFLSAKFKAKHSFKEFSETFATTRAMSLLATATVKRDENSATVNVTLEETEADSRRVQWQGPIELVRESEGWRIDTMRGLRKIPNALASAATRTKLPATTGQPARTPAFSWDRPRIYLQMANDSQRRAATELKRRLTGSGYVVVGIDNALGNVDIPTESSELRYFTQGHSGSEADCSGTGAYLGKCYCLCPGRNALCFARSSIRDLVIGDPPVVFLLSPGFSSGAQDRLAS